MDATGLVRSHAHHWSMCGCIAEHAPMLKSSNTRRSGSLPGCCASPTTTVDMRQRVGVRRGGRSNSSDPSTTDMTRLWDRSAASKTARKALAVMTADILRWRQDDPQAQSAPRHRDHSQPPRMWHPPTLRTANPAGQLAASMWRSCSSNDTTTILLTQGCPRRLGIASPEGA